jgi:TRAP-type C4-dicarboxylate transport system substrate-binding protein
MQRLGATGVPMPLDQVLPALQTGAIDGVLSTIIVSTPFKYYSVAKYFLQLSPSMLTTVAVVSRSWFEKLPPDLQAIVTNDGQKVGRGMLPFTENYVKDEIKTWTASGGEYIRFSPSDQEQVRSKIADVASDVLKTEPESKRLYDLLVQTARKYR